MVKTKRKIVIFTGFNRAKFPKLGREAVNHKTLTEEWIRYRFNIWKQYTWQSILNQDFYDWVYCFCCDPASQEFVDRYFGQIKDKRFFVTYSETKRARQLMKVLASGNDEMVNVRIDSDDMYHPRAIGELNYALDDYGNDWFQWSKGFAFQYDNPNGKLKQYHPGHGSGPFFAHRYRTSDWLSTGIIKECQHQWVRKNNPVKLSNGRIIVGIHGGNTGTFWRTGCFKREIKGERKHQILKEFCLL